MAKRTVSTIFHVQLNTVVCVILIILAVIIGVPFFVIYHGSFTLVKGLFIVGCVFVVISCILSIRRGPTTVENEDAGYVPMIYVSRDWLMEEIETVKETTVDWDPVYTQALRILEETMPGLVLTLDLDFYNKQVEAGDSQIRAMAKTLINKPTTADEQKGSDDDD